MLFTPLAIILLCATVAFPALVMVAFVQQQEKQLKDCKHWFVNVLVWSLVLATLDIIQTSKSIAPDTIGTLFFFAALAGVFIGSILAPKHGVSHDG